MLLSVIKKFNLYTINAPSIVKTQMSQLNSPFPDTKTVRSSPQMSGSFSTTVKLSTRMTPRSVKLDTPCANSSRLAGRNCVRTTASGAIVGQEATPVEWTGKQKLQLTSQWCTSFDAKKGDDFSAYHGEA